MSNNDRTDRGGRGNGQQGTGGLDNGQAVGAPDPQGRQPHLGNAANRSAHSAPGGTGETEGNGERRITTPGDHEELDALDAKRTTSHHDRLRTIEAADDRTEALNPHRGAAANDASGNLRDVLAGPVSNEGYVSGARHETPILGATDDDADNM